MHPCSKLNPDNFRQVLYSIANGNTEREALRTYANASFKPLENLKQKSLNNRHACKLALILRMFGELSDEIPCDEDYKFIGSAVNAVMEKRVKQGERYFR